MQKNKYIYDICVFIKDRSVHTYYLKQLSFANPISKGDLIQIDEKGFEYPERSIFLGVVTEIHQIGSRNQKKIKSLLETRLRDKDDKIDELEKSLL